MIEAMQSRFANAISRVRRGLTTPTEEINQAIGYLKAMTDMGALSMADYEVQLANFTRMITEM